MEKYINNIFRIGVLSILVIGFTSCSEDALDKVDNNLNNPIDAGLSLILPVTQTGLAYEVVGGDMSLYIAVWSQLVTGVHAQLHQMDRFVYTASVGNNTWGSAYRTGLKNLKIIMEKGEEAGADHYVGIAQVQYAYTVSVLTDAFGRIPYTDAVLGAASTAPTYDSQESIYTDPTTGILAMIDNAIINLESTSSTATPSGDDLFYGGDMDLWVKAAYAVKAKMLTRLKNTSAYDANEVISAVNNSFSDASEAFIFTAFSAGATTEHPWFQEENDRAHFAASMSLFDMMNTKGDPRMATFFDNGAASIPAPNGTAQLDQGGALYTKMYGIVNADSPLEIVTYDQIRLFEAEAHLSLGNTADANTAYEAAVLASLTRYGVSTADATTYTGQTAVFPGAGSLSEDDIHEQRYLSYYPFQCQEAYASWRRSGFPNLTNPNGVIPRRFPLPQSEFDTNGGNAPSIAVVNGVWWDDGTED